MGPFVVWTSTLPPQSATAIGPFEARSFTLPFTPRTSIGPFFASRFNEASRGACTMKTAVHSAESVAGPVYEIRPAECATEIPRAACSAAARVSAAPTLQVSTE